MFVLRTINQDGIERNQFIGNDYSFFSKECNEKEFDELANAINCDNCECYAFINFYDGGKTVPLYKNCENFIMTSDGATFSNVSFK